MASDAAALSEALRPGGKHLVIQAWPSPGLLAGLAGCLGEAASQGRHVAVLDRAVPQALGGRLLGRVHTDPGHYTQGQGLAATPKFLAAQLGDPEAAGWLDRLGLVLVPRGEQIFRRPYDWEVLAASLKDRADERGLPPPRLVVVVAPRVAAESALRDILPLASGPGDWLEVHLRGEAPQRLWWTVWTAQDPESYKNGLNPRPKGPGHWGSGPVLAHFAGLWNVRSSRLLSHAQQADVDQGQAMQRDEGRLCYQPAPADGWDAGLEGPGAVGAVTLYDPHGNPWRGLQAVGAAGGRAVLANIVSRHTAFQGYFLANAQHFARQPWQPLSPKKTEAAEAPLDTLTQLVRRIKTAGRLRLAVVEQALRGARLLAAGEGAASAQFKRLLARHLHPAVADALAVSRERRWNPGRGRFETAAYLSLAAPDVLAARVDWLRPFRVCDDTGGEEYLRLGADHVLQTFLPGQTAVLAGRTFKIKRVDWAGGTVYASHDDTLGQPDYRPCRRVELRTPAGQRRPAGMAGFPVVQHQHGYRVDKTFYRLDFSVHAPGYYESADQWAGPPHYHALPEDLPARHYREGRAARLRLLDAEGAASLLSAPAAVALAAWLNEAAELLFPETGRFLVAAADVAPADHPAGEPAQGIAVRLGGECAADHSVWVFEDSAADLGLARALLDHCQAILDLCADHLGWLLEENAQDARPGEPACLENRLLPAADFFRYGGAGRDPALGLEALLEALRRLAPWFGAGALSRRRRASLAAGAALDLAEGGGAAEPAHCDFCGAAVAGGAWQILREDGRVRCMDCQACGVDTLAQLQALYPLARSFLGQGLKLAVVENIELRLASQADLARRAGRAFIPTAGFDPRAVGLAVARSELGGRERHEVWIESGFPPEQTAATLAHEMAHIWQYNHLDHAALRRDSGNLLLEGHAVWTALAFLRGQCARPAAPFDPARLRRALQSLEAAAQRDDEYGQGYALLLERAGGREPGAWLLKRYPR